MNPTLERFFAQMRPFLAGEHDADAVQHALGPSSSGTENFDFYRVLVERNYFKILREVFPCVRTLVQREVPALWRELVTGYVRVHPPGHWDPNELGREFPRYLEVWRERLGGLSCVVEELADYCWIRHLAHTCPDDVGDGFDRRLFVRRYTYPIPAYARELERGDPGAAVPAQSERLILLYRDFGSLENRVLAPSAAAWVALARRQRLDVPDALRSIPEDLVQRAERDLVTSGVLLPMTSA